jgi:holo-[acyl-carrier protein] synthase
MIVGVGADIVQIERMRRLVGRFGVRAASRILAPEELEAFAESRAPERLLAKRFAAKEAFGKALGIGLREPATLCNLAVCHDELGRPSFRYAAALARLMDERGWTAHLSLSDDGGMAAAFVVLESEGDAR